MDVDGANNRAGGQADDQADNTMDGDDAPPSADTMDTSDDDRTGDQAEDTMDSDSTADDADDADATDANVFEIITQTRTSILPHSDSIAPNPEQVPSAESDPPPNPPNPLEPDSPDAHPQVVVEHFPHGNPGAPINGTPGCSIYESTQDALGGSVWAPFQSECDWRFAHWAKMHGPSSSALTDLLAIPNVCSSPPFFFFFIVLLNVV